MRKDKMQLTLVASEIMDEWAKKNKSEHNKVRLSKRARLYYKPSEWKKIYMKIHGLSAALKLRIGQAPKEEISHIGPKQTKEVGFVTTETYRRLMGNKRTKESIWISENSQDITIGCDPEFALVDPDTNIGKYARDVLPFHQALGSDGPCAELRPAPSNNPEDLIDRIKSLLETYGPSIQQYKWIGGASYKHPSMESRYCIGGHIHLGLPRLQGAALQTDVLLQKRVARILDEMVAIPLIKIDTPLPEERRKQYGSFGDVRSDTYKMEWRVPSGIWLIHPEISRVVLNTTKAITEEIWKKYEDRDCKKSFMIDVSSKDNLQKAFKCADSEKVREIINKSKRSDISDTLINDTHSKLREMSTYRKYKDHIDRFVQICCSEKMLPTEDKLELRRGWLENKTL